MRLYTGRGDDGSTTLRDTKGGARVSKGAQRIEALGAIDELNSYLGYCRAVTDDEREAAACLDIQHDLFAIQAEIAGSEMGVPLARVAELEASIDELSRTLPPLTSFCVPGQTALSACLDIARTLARRAERRVIAAGEEQQLVVRAATPAYLNRLSSLLYVLARRANQRAGAAEIAPRYPA
jgi:cob(I)alamin adenosyltransferase